MSDIIFYPDPRLNQTAAARSVDDAMRAVGDALLATARQVQAYGLAAHHIGFVEPVAVVSLSDEETRDYRVLYNPRLVGTSGALVAGPEGSVSMPGVEVDVVRPDRADVAYDDETGQVQTLSLNGFAARVAQHEIDQVKGVFFLSKISRLKRETVLRKFRKANR